MALRCAPTPRAAHLLHLGLAAHLCWVLVAVRSLSAAPAEYHIDSWTTDNGLPQNVIEGVCQTPWALAHTSVVRWNEGESRFVELPSQKSKYGHLSNSERFGFWGINRDDLRLFIRGNIFHYLLPRGWPRGALTTASQDLNGIIWLATPDGRLAKLSGGHWSKIIRTSGGQTKLPQPSDLASTYRDSRGNLWNIGVASHPVMGLLRYLSLPSRGQPRKIAFNSFFEDREGSIWLATDGQGLYRIRKQAISVFSKEDGLPDRNIYPIYQDRTGSIWIGTWDAGLVRLSGGKPTTFSIADGLLSRRINSISEDREGALWVATPAGLQKMRKGRFELVRTEGLEDRGEGEPFTKTVRAHCGLERAKAWSAAKAGVGVSSRRRTVWQVTTPG
jgi:hypothetical protein